MSTVSMNAEQIAFAGAATDLAEQLRPLAAEPFVFLDSSTLQPEADSRFAVIARHPWFDLRVVNQQTLRNGQSQSETIWELAQQFLAQHETESARIMMLYPELPFYGGLLGCLGYDFAVREQAGLVRLPDTGDLTLPEAWLQAFDQWIVVDRLAKTVTLFAWGQLQSAKKSLKELKQAVDCCLSRQDPIAISPDDFRTYLSQHSNFTPAAYQNQIAQVISEIGAGEVYILNLTHRFELPDLIDPWATYRLLRKASPTAFSAYYQAGEQRLLCFSPEQFLQVRGRRITTRPIKGTRPRGQTAESDAQNRAELLASEKDRAELLMIVDLERNDLSPVCEPASVKVSELFKLESYQTVFHLVATVEGQLAAGETAVSALKACFPGGSITGAPKIRAMQLISHFEGMRRGLYTGILGYLSLDGQADFNILIRTIFTDGQRTTYHAGGGITWDSDVKSEYEETLDKSQAIGGAFNV